MSPLKKIAKTTSKRLYNMCFLVSSKDPMVFAVGLIRATAPKYLISLGFKIIINQDALSEGSSQAHQQRESVFLCFLHKNCGSSSNSTIIQKNKSGRR